VTAFLARVSEQRQKFLDGLRANAGEINLDIFEDFYPDQAHFVFELLQNAEDTGATEASFKLTTDGCCFEHNGPRAFTEADVRAITGIHDSTKKQSSDKIGKFGVGFKSVFVYTRTPAIYSADLAFKITDYVLPVLIAPDRVHSKRTKFWLPFNNPRKPPEKSYSEIEVGLTQLAETTLLFLPNLESIKWEIGNVFTGEILRIEHSRVHIEVLKQVDGNTTTSAHFLRFDQPVCGLETQRVALAFGLEFLPKVQAVSVEKPLAEQLRIAPVQGQVAVFFPANKEVSGLRFHLHAPFVPELSRASIKDSPANHPLFDQLAELSVASLHEVRNLGLLTTDFLGVLPSLQDSLGKGYGYDKIRSAIHEAMKAQPLFPTLSKGYAPAKCVVQAKASLKELLTAEDMRLLARFGDNTITWAVNRALQGTNVERFMSSLSIREWDWDAFLKRIIHGSAELIRASDPAFLHWLTTKNVEWHQSFYALLTRESEAREELQQLKRSKIVRLTNGKYANGKEAHFSSEKMSGDSVQFVDPAVYSSGKNKSQQENARQFLVSIGVTEVGELELVAALVKQAYSGAHQPVNERKHLADVKRFIKLYESNASSASLFATHPILLGADGQWRMPNQCFIDAPYLDTALNEYRSVCGKSFDRAPLSPIYEALRTEKHAFIAFATALGAQTVLEPESVSCVKNPQWGWLSSAPGQRYRSPVDRDFIFRGFSALAAAHSERLARLVWRTMCSLPNTDYVYLASHKVNPLIALYRKTESGGAHRADSQLVHQLRKERWVPQKGGSFVAPADARPELLPEGYTFDAGWPWLKAITFGERVDLQKLHAAAKDVEMRELEHQAVRAAKLLGFDNAETARMLASMPLKDQERALLEYRRRARAELPEHVPSNLARRRERVIAQLADAPIRRVENRTRSVSVSRDEVKEEAKQYLRHQYTVPNGEQVCQICRDELPFRLHDETFYFEAVELIVDLDAHYVQNYLCLCPNHAAMFKYANAARESFAKRLASQTDNEMSVVLAGREESIYFTKAHLADLSSIVEVEK